jgi:hypothetical protein
VSRNRRSPEWYTAQGLLEGTRGRARASVRRHYDLGNDFYARWLDRDTARRLFTLICALHSNG